MQPTPSPTTIIQLNDMGLRAFATEYYPDMTEKEYGKKVLRLSCSVTNGKRFRSLTFEERKVLAELIDGFQISLELFKKEIISGHYNSK